jgi:tetratricopeptide (TPR) repeat protein
MEQILMVNGYEVRSTCRQPDAIGIAKTFEPQVVMLGLTMPVTLGSKLFALPSVSKIVLFGEVDESEDLERRRDYYDFDLLPTPFDAERLLNNMRSWVAEAWTREGLNVAATGRDLEALQFYEKALTIDPRNEHAWFHKGSSLYDLGGNGDISDRVGRFEQAIFCFDSALAISPDNVSGWLWRGRALHQLGRYKEALLCYDKVFEIDHPTWTASARAHFYSDVWNSKGTSLYRMRRYRESIECYEKAIAMDEFAFAWYNKGNSLREMTNFGEAIRCYDRTIELDPNHARSWNNKGVCLRKMGQMKEALLCHERAVICNPPEILGWYAKALIQDDLERIEDAIHSYEKYLAVAPPDQPDNVKHAQERLQHLKSRSC